MTAQVTTKANGHIGLTWEDFGEAIRELASMIVASGRQYDLVLGLARGGLIPAGALAYALNIKPCASMNVELYTDIEETLPEPIVLPPLISASDLAAKRVLVVDDVADSGRSLKFVMEMLERWGVDADSAMILEKPRSVYKPTFAWKLVEGWIDFPWSYQGPVPGVGQN